MNVKNIVRNKYISMIILIMTLIMISPTIGAGTTENVSNTIITYRSDVDQDYGFHRVIDYTTHKPTSYVNRTLNINVGDTVEWINDATPDEPLTIMSKEGLWGNRSAYLRWNYQKFSYTFNQSGTYEIYIKEYPREQHQIIVVKDNKIIPTPTITLTTNPTVNETKNLSSVPTVAGSGTPAYNKSIPIEIIVGVVFIVAFIVILIIYMIRGSKRRDK